MKYQKLNAKKAGLASGIFFAIAFFLIGLIGMTGWGIEFVKLMGTIYIGFKASFLGSIIGAAYAFIDGFLIGWLITWIYNKLL
jgi:hypothetical protein